LVGRDFFQPTALNCGGWHEIRFPRTAFPEPMSDSKSSTVPTSSIFTAPSRRTVIGRLGLTGLALAFTQTHASAFIGNRKYAGSTRPAVDLSSLPHEWIRREGALLNEYTHYLAALKLRKVGILQVLSAHAKERGGVWNGLPPRHWWNRMGYTLRVVDRIAHELNSPVSEVLSAYRSPAYNAKCSGARTGSWHQANVAVDVKFPVRASTVTATTRNLRDRGLFKGGVGSYGNFTHIDTRGQNINW
jgi:hypothetical protein